MHSASAKFLSRYVEWIIVGKNWNPLPTNEPRMFTDLSERINPFPTHTLEGIPFNKLAKFQFAE